MVARDFPFLQVLSIFNDTAQKYKQHTFSVNRFGYLVKLHLTSVHIDYANELVVETKSYLPCLKRLQIDFHHT